MKSYKGYLIDLDGTMYRGTEPIPEAGSFVRKLASKGIPYLFVTNNSSATPADVAKKLQSMDVPCKESHVLTTSLSAATYLSNRPVKQSAYVIGENGLRKAIETAGIVEEQENPGFVVIGMDRSVTYQKLANACLAVRNGAHFVSTNADVALPSERGFLPGNGALTSVISISTGTEPVFIGKPETIMIEQAVEMLGLKPEETVVVGDNYDTDIKAGINAGLDTIHVGTGVTLTEELDEKPIAPTYAISSLCEWDM
ncbi:TIGR01457 family HAD-type hydrolase [Salibacterium salarium]|uniref:TIGR01457 family HAD-type hydrolase n=1 Tax=Salibacterium salarium TaxID=284579 RepID=A0A3R9P704_9BACI|nr:TIGR01457 family HAD-type hydrolase [Salibacterium salarium]RSL34134.1 TIGR01457 family HAD-type hydrolase [Salibacterium salarium]